MLGFFRDLGLQLGSRVAAPRMRESLAVWLKRAERLLLRPHEGGTAARRVTIRALTSCLQESPITPEESLDLSDYSLYTRPTDGNRDCACACAVATNVHAAVC